MEAESRQQRPPVQSCDVDQRRRSGTTASARHSFQTVPSPAPVQCTHFASHIFMAS